ncbi:tetratricopeptide repeat protein [Streptococcus cameli]
MNNSEKMLDALERQDLQQAETYFKKALALDDEETLYQLGTYLESIGFYPHAKEIYLKLVEIYPELALNLAQIAYEDGETEEAFAYLESLGQDSLYYVESLVVKADLYQSEGLADVAREKMVEALAFTDEPLLHFGLAELDMELGNFKEAIQTYARLDNREMYELTGVSTYQRIGVAYASLGKFEAAIEFLEKALELEYEDQTAYELATLLYEQEQYQKANIYFKHLDAITPDFEGYEYAYAQSLHAEHQLDEALLVLQKGLEKNAFDVALLLLASQYAYENHAKDLSEQYLIKAKDVADDLDEVILRLSQLYLEEERFEEVISLASDDLDSVLAKWNIAKAYIALDEIEQALAAFDQLKDDLKENPDFLADYVALLRQEGAVSEAKAYAKLYLNLVPDDMDMQDFYENEE